MENRIKYINILLRAFESRNEILREEVKKNEEAIADLKSELLELSVNNEEEIEKVVA